MRRRQLSSLKELHEQTTCLLAAAEVGGDVVRHFAGSQRCGAAVRRPACADAKYTQHAERPHSCRHVQLAVRLQRRVARRVFDVACGSGACHQRGRSVRAVSELGAVGASAICVRLAARTLHTVRRVRNDRHIAQLAVAAKRQLHLARSSAARHAAWRECVRLQAPRSARRRTQGDAPRTCAESVLVDDNSSAPREARPSAAVAVGAVLCSVWT